MTVSAAAAGALGASAALLGWIYVGYALLLAAVSRRRPTPPDPPDSELPRVTVLLPVRNESVVIRRKLDNLAAQGYPGDRLEVIVADGASTDGTLDQVRSHAPGVRTIALPKSVGKARTINAALPAARGEIVVVTDANAYMEPGCLQRLAAAFRDPRVGAATGAMRQRDLSGNPVAAGGDAYWRTEVFLRTREAQLHSVIAMSGELSAFRRSLFVRPDGNVVDWFTPGGTDDFEMTLWVIRHGYRVGYVPDAEVWELAPDTLRDLFGQKVRIIAQTIVSVRRNLAAVLRRGGWYAVTFVSRKALPLLSPGLFAIALLATAALAPSWPPARVLLGVELAGVALALLGFGPLARFGPARMANFLLLLNATVAVAWFQYVRGRDYTLWQPVASTRRA